MTTYHFPFIPTFLTIKQKLGLVAAGALASLAMPPLSFLPLICCLSYGGFLFLTHAFVGITKFWRAWFGFAIGWFMGFGWFLASLHWLVQALITGGTNFYKYIPFALTFVPAGLAAFWGIGFALATLPFSKIDTSQLKVDPKKAQGITQGMYRGMPWFRHKLDRLSLLVVCFMALEWLRGFILTGFPWQTPGMLFAFAPFDIGVGFSVVSLFGVWGCGVIACLIAFFPLTFLMARTATIAIGGMVAVAFIAGVAVEGREVQPTAATGMAVRVVQPSIPQQEKWKRDKQADHLNRHVTASRADLPPHSPKLIVWGETAYTGFLNRDIDELEFRFATATRANAWLVTGGLGTTPTDDEYPLIHNSAYLLTPLGEIISRYDKQHLVPFGEYLPGSRLIPFITHLVGIGDFAPGADLARLYMLRDQTTLVTIAPMICYEIIFPSLVRRTAHRTEENLAADIIVNLTNDTWFGNSLGPRQHLAMAQMRAAELGIPVIRAANSGISAIIDPYGKITTRVGYNVVGWGDGVVTGRVTTLYYQIGDLGFACLMAGLILLVVVLGRSKTS